MQIQPGKRTASQNIAKPGKTEKVLYDFLLQLPGKPGREKLEINGEGSASVAADLSQSTSVTST